MDAVRTLRERLRWSQKQLADHLACDQATVSRIENGQEPSGPIGRLLAGLQADVAAGRIQPDQPRAKFQAGAAA